MSRELKAKTLNTLLKQLEEKTTQLSHNIAEVKASRDENTKSSAGDKYETSRAMMQIELEKNETQLSKNQELIKYLSQIDLSQSFERVDFGSFVTSPKAYYFLSIGYGKLTVDSADIYVISLASPIGQMLKHKRIGDIIPFQNQNIEIKAID